MQAKEAGAYASNGKAAAIYCNVSLGNDVLLPLRSERKLKLDVFVVVDAACECCLGVDVPRE